MLTIEDFPEDFHRIIFGSIDQLFKKDAKKIEIIDIENYLSRYKKYYKIFEVNNGIEYLEQAIELCNPETFEYNCNRIKKFTLLRKLEENGFSIKPIYDEDDENKLINFDKMTIGEIIDFYNSRISSIESTFIQVDEGSHISNGVDELLEELENNPVIGYDCGINALNYYLYGLRKKYYIFSAASGIGKTRYLIFSSLKLGFEQNIPTLFISTELPIDEIQTIMLAYIAKVEERKILTNTLNPDERQKVKEAKEKLKQSNIYISYLPDFDLQKLEHLIKKYILKQKIEFCIFDYIKESISAIEGLNKRIGQVEGWKGLMLTSERLKMLCEKFKVGIISATQLNGGAFAKDYESNQSLLAGAKGIANSVDVGAIIRPVKTKEVEAYDLELIPSEEENTYLMAIDVYKNRRGMSPFTVYLRTNLGKLYYKEIAVVKGGNIIKPPIVDFAKE